MRQTQRRTNACFWGVPYHTDICPREKVGDFGDVDPENPVKGPPPTHPKRWFPLQDEIFMSKKNPIPSAHFEVGYPIFPFVDFKIRF